MAPTVSQSKLVDFALLFQPNHKDPPMAFQALLQSLPFEQRTLSQTDYGPLRYFPAPVAIETKTSSGDLEEAKVQLGVWVAAWFRRVRLLLRGNTETIPVPMIVIEAGKWAVYYACDQENAIVRILSSVSYFPHTTYIRAHPLQSIYGPDDIGDTLTMEGIYKLLASIRAIGKWLGQEFGEWFLNDVAQEYPER